MLHKEFNGNLSRPNEELMERIEYKILYTNMILSLPTVFNINLQALSPAAPSPSEKKESEQYDYKKSEKALALAKAQNNQSAIPNLMQELGIAYFFKAVQAKEKRREEMSDALEICLKAFKLHYANAMSYLRHPFLPEFITPKRALHLMSIANISHYLGRIYHDLGGYDFAELYYTLELKIRAGLISITQKTDYFLSRSCLYMGYTYSAMNQSQQAIQYYGRAIAAQKQLDDSLWIVGRANHELAVELKKLAINHFKLSQVTLIRDTAIYEEYKSAHLEKAKNYLLTAADCLQNTITVYTKSSSKEFVKRLWLAKKELKEVETEQSKVNKQLDLIKSNSTSNESKSEKPIVNNEAPQKDPLPTPRVSEMGFLSHSAKCASQQVQTNPHSTLRHR